MTINPIALNGPWDEGWALDMHTISSECIGENPFGYKQYSTVRTQIGESLYQLKYCGHYNRADSIASAALEFLAKLPWFKEVDLILPAPPSRARDIQPAFLIADKLASMSGRFYSDEALVKTLPQEAKDLTGIQKLALSSSVKLVKKILRPCNILVVDDVASSGSTLSACTQALKGDPNVQHVYVLAITKTRSRG